MCTTAYAQNGSVDALLKTGNDYSNLFQYDKAYENFRKATELEPDNWEGWFLGGKCLLRLKKLDEAEKFLTKAHDLKPDEVDVQKALGSIYINYAKTAATNGQIAAKLDYQLKACHAYPAGTKIWLALFEQWWQNGEFEKIKAEGDFIVKNNKELLDQADDESLQASLVYVAKAYYGDADYATADKFLTHASKIRCQNDELYTLKREIKNRGEEKIKKILNQAQSEIESKNYDKAIETLKNASKQPGAHQAEIQEKIEQLEKTININKYLEEIAGLIKSEKYSEASVKLEEALGTYPENEELTAKYTKIGCIYDTSDTYSSGIYDAFDAKMKELGKEYTTRTFDADNKKDFSAQVEALKDCEVIFCPFYYTEASLVARACAAKEFDNIELFGCDGFDGLTPILEENVKNPIRYITPFDVESTDEFTSKFVKNYTDKYGVAPDQFAADGYDAVYIIKNALERAGVKDANVKASDIADDLVAVLTDPSFGYAGVTGEMTWDETGACTKVPVIVVLN